jgi:hypothetical protein
MSIPLKDSLRFFEKQISSLLIAIAVLLSIYITPGHSQSTNSFKAPSSHSPSSTNALERPSQVFQIITGVGTILTGLGTLFVLFQSFKLTRRLKEADVLMECYRRFDVLVDRRETICAGGSSADSTYYYERFWNLQNDEFSLFKGGYIDEKTYGAWLAARHEEHVVNSQIGDRTYRQGWEHIKTFNKDQEFIGFMEEVFKGNASKAMSAYRKRKRTSPI